MRGWFQDLVLVLRFCRKRAGFVALVVLCYALGIGANSAIFSLVNVALLRPLPYERPETLYLLFDVHRDPGGEAETYEVSPLNLLEWQQRITAFTNLEAMEPREVNLQAGDEPEQIRGAAVTAGLFELLGTQPLRGRSFNPEEDRPGGPASVIISHGLWSRRFGADPDILERTLTLDRRSFNIVGVMRPDFHYLEPADVWVPLALDSADPRSRSHYLFVLGRLRPGKTLQAAQTELDTVAAALADDLPQTHTGWGIQAVGLREYLVGDFRTGLLVLLAAVGLVLLIACANVSNLLLVRATEQRSEIAVRIAFGASRHRLVRQMVTEGTFFALAGAVVGIFLAVLALRSLAALGPFRSTLFENPTIDLRVLGFTSVLALLAGLLPALLPALRASRADLASRLREGGPRTTESRQGRRLQGAMVVAEIALALVLLTCAGLLLRSFSLLHRIDPGFDSSNALKVQVSLPQTRYPGQHEIGAFWRRLLPQIETLPGVVAAGVTSDLPITPSPIATTFGVEDRAESAPGEILLANFRRISPEYLRTMGIELISGRGFRSTDDEEGPAVILVSREMAEHCWPGVSPLGKRIKRGGLQRQDRPWMTVVGVVENVQDTSLGEAVGMTFYMPMMQGSSPTMNIVLRTSTQPFQLVPAVRKAVLAVDPAQPIAEVSTLEDYVADSLSRHRFVTLMFGLFAGLGLVLASVGIYGVLSYSVKQQSHEIGVRIALGAQVGDVIALVLRRGLVLTGIGLGIGIVVTAIFTRLLSSLLYQVAPTDPWTLVGVALGLTAVSMLASYLPARQASRVDPIESFRTE